MDLRCSGFLFFELNATGARFSSSRKGILG